MEVPIVIPLPLIESNLIGKVNKQIILSEFESLDFILLDINIFICIFTSKSILIKINLIIIRFIIIIIRFISGINIQLTIYVCFNN